MNEILGLIVALFGVMVLAVVLVAAITLWRKRRGRRDWPDDEWDEPLTDILPAVREDLSEPWPLPLSPRLHERTMVIDVWQPVDPVPARKRFERTVVETFEPGTVPIFEQLERDFPALRDARDRALRTPTMEINLVFSAIVAAYDYSCEHCLDGDHRSCVGCECECTLVGAR